MQLGIFAKTFGRPTLAGVFDAVASHDLPCVQFNFACAGLPSMPAVIEPALCDEIRGAAEARGITIAAVSGTFNMIHPDAAVRRDGLARLGEMAANCRRLGTSIITLCTGTRDPQDMWRRHPENDSAEAWGDLLASLREAIELADEHGVTLGVEPETANVVDSAAKARRLLDEVGSPRLKIVIDPANLLRAGDLPRMGDILDEAFELLGAHIVLAHAKDVTADLTHVAAGQGVLDYDRYLALLAASGFTGPLILHGLSEQQVSPSLAFLQNKFAAIPRQART